MGLDTRLYLNTEKLLQYQIYTNDKAKVTTTVMTHRN